MTGIVLLQRSKWVDIKTLEHMTGYTRAAANKKRSTGVWLEGKHWRKAPDNTVRYNWAAIDEWVES